MMLTRVFATEINSNIKIIDFEVRSGSTASFWGGGNLKTLEIANPFFQQAMLFEKGWNCFGNNFKSKIKGKMNLDTQIVSLALYLVEFLISVYVF